MSKRYKIKWTDSDQQELKKAIRNFNDKIRRLEKQYPELKYNLPNKVKFSDYKNKDFDKSIIKTRQDLKREINSLKRFTDKNNVIRKKADGSYQGLSRVSLTNDNILLTNWQIKEMRKSIPSINKSREARRQYIQNLPATLRNKLLGYKVGDVGMGNADARKLDPMKAFYPSMSTTGAHARFKNILKERSTMYWQTREEMMMNNYIKGIENNFKDGTMEDVIKAIKKLDFAEFYSKFLSDQMKFEYYHTDKEQENEYAEYLKATWVPNYKTPQIMQGKKLSSKPAPKVSKVTDVTPQKVKLPKSYKGGKNQMETPKVQTPAKKKVAKTSPKVKKAKITKKSK